MSKRQKIKTPERPERDQMVFALLRLLRGKNHSQAVKGTYISPQTVANMRRPMSEGGTRYPRADTIRALAEAHGASLQLVALTAEAEQMMPKKPGPKTGWRKAELDGAVSNQVN